MQPTHCKRNAQAAGPTCAAARPRCGSACRAAAPSPTCNLLPTDARSPAATPRIACSRNALQQQLPRSAGARAPSGPRSSSAGPAASVQRSSSPPSQVGMRRKEEGARCGPAGFHLPLAGACSAPGRHPRPLRSCRSSPGPAAARQAAQSVPPPPPPCGLSLGGVADSAAAPPPPPPGRRLCLMRHADSDPAGRGVRDHDRPITQLGAAEARQVRSRAGAGGRPAQRQRRPSACCLALRAAPGVSHERLGAAASRMPSADESRLLARRPSQVAEQLKAAGWMPQVVVCSNAQRTRQTLDEMQRVRRAPGRPAGRPAPLPGCLAAGCLLASVLTRGLPCAAAAAPSRQAPRPSPPGCLLCAAPK